MRVQISYEVEVDDRMLADIFFHYTARDGMADEEMVRRWFMRNASGYLREENE